MVCSLTSETQRDDARSRNNYFLLRLSPPFGPPEDRTTWILPAQIPDAQCSLSTTSTILVCSCAPGLSGAVFAL